MRSLRKASPHFDVSGCVSVESHSTEVDTSLFWERATVLKWTLVSVERELSIPLFWWIRLKTKVQPDITQRGIQEL